LKLLRQRCPIETKQIDIVGGPNGSGKTTFAESFFLGTQAHPVFLNPDQIAGGIAPLDFENIARVKHRAKMGGHSIPRDTILRRHKRCFFNFWHLYRPLCNNWFVFDNSNTKPKLLMDWSTYGQLSSYEQEKFAKRFLAGKP
jgi:predicted ABC-type ATPase